MPFMVWNFLVYEKIGSNVRVRAKHERSELSLPLRQENSPRSLVRAIFLL